MHEGELELAFMPALTDRYAFLQGGGRLVHYTSAQAGFLIIKNREVWLRNALLMNDFSEIAYGIECLARLGNRPVAKS